MSGLATIWIGTAALLTLSLATILLLIVVRMVQQHMSGRRAAKRRHIAHRLLAYVIGTDDGASLKGQLAGTRDISGELMLELVQLIRGQERARLLVLLTDLSVPRSLLRDLRRGRHPRRILAAAALRYFDDPEVIAGLRRALDDRDSQVRLGAAASLAELGAAPPLAELMARLRPDQLHGSHLLRLVFRRLAATDPESVASALTLEAPDSVKVLALDALGRSGNYGAVPKIAAIATSRASIEVRLEALRSLGLLRHPNGLPAIRQSLFEPDWEIRTQAVVAAGRVGAEQVVPELHRMLDDPAWWARFRAAEALLQLGRPGLLALKSAAAAGAGHAPEIARQVLAERDVR